MKIFYIADINSVYTRRWVNFFSSSGHSVKVASIGSLDTRIVGNIHPDTEVHAIAPKWISRLSRHVFLPLRFLVHLYCIRKLIDEFQPDVVHAHFAHYNGWLAAFAGFRPYIVSGWGSDIHTAPKKFFLYKALTKYTLAHADMVTTGSDYLSSLVVELGAPKARVHTVYHGINLRTMRPITPEERREVRNRLDLRENPVIFSPRLLRPFYHIDLIVRSIPAVLEKRPDVLFVLSKTGAVPSYASDVERLIAELGVTGNIRFIGNEKEEDMHLFYGVSVLTISIPESDSAGGANWEAMACGSVPLVCDLPAYRQYLDEGGNAYYLPSREPSEIARTILEVLDKSQENESIKCNNLEAIKTYCYHTSMRRMEKLYFTAVPTVS